MSNECRKEKIDLKGHEARVKQTEKCEVDNRLKQKNKFEKKK